MTPTTQEIFDRFEVRKTGKQKTAFRDWLIPLLEQNRYHVTVEKGSIGTRNVVIGDVSTARVVFTAHYDTCSVLPFPNFITPKAPLIYVLYQLLICVPILGLVFLGAYLAYRINPELMMVGYWAAFAVVMGSMLCGPANRHTANDNTSGVTAIVDLALSMPREHRDKVAFVLFDLEEAGLIGSSSFASKHKKVMKDKLLVNLDCVSDGETMLFAVKKKAARHLPALEKAFPSDSAVTADFVTRGYVYPSDQANFPLGVGVAALKKTRFGLLYMDRIHTKRDTVYREANIRWLVDGCIRLTQNL